MMGQKWPDCDANLKNYIDDVVQFFVEELKEELVAICLHGSLAMGSFYPPKSDIDLLIIVENSLTVTQKIRLHEGLCVHAEKRPITGFIELSVLTKEHAQQPKYPVLCELSFDEKIAERIKNADIKYTEIGMQSPDLAAHFMAARHCNLSLYGPQPMDILGDVSWKNYVASIMDDLDWILDKENILISPFYSVLNICRVLEVMAKGEGTVSSKEDGALWALESLPNAYHNIIDFALKCYQSNEFVMPKQRRTAGKKWDKIELLAFRDFMRAQIETENGFTIKSPKL
jgi:predicted nucleotidyltransferase